jgi:hypothetical protein
MGELILNLIFYAFQGIGFLVRKWILPRISGGRLVILPLLNEPVGPIWSWKRLPNGQFGIEPIFFSMVFAMFPEYAPRRALPGVSGVTVVTNACAFYHCTRGFCNGRWLVNPFLRYPFAGDLLLFGIGAGPSPDGVQERNRSANLRKA